MTLVCTRLFEGECLMVVVKMFCNLITVLLDELLRLYRQLHRNHSTSVIQAFPSPSFNFYEPFTSLLSILLFLPLSLFLFLFFFILRGVRVSFPMVLYYPVGKRARCFENNFYSIFYSTTMGILCIVQIEIGRVTRSNSNWKSFSTDLTAFPRGKSHSNHYSRYVIDTIRRSNVSRSYDAVFHTPAKFRLPCTITDNPCSKIVS